MASSVVSAQSDVEAEVKEDEVARDKDVVDAATEIPEAPEPVQPGKCVSMPNVKIVPNLSILPGLLIYIATKSLRVVEEVEVEVIGAKTRSTKWRKGG